MGNPAKALIFKASGAAGTGFQQSYPQKRWIALQSLLNQRLEAALQRRLQESPVNAAFA
jgi:hypothetical protein